MKIDFARELLLKERNKLEDEKDQLRRYIDGSLNRISITDDESERDGQVGYIEHYVQKYKELSRESHKLFNEINKNILSK